MEQLFLLRDFLLAIRLITSILLIFLFFFLRFRVGVIRGFHEARVLSVLPIRWGKYYVSICVLVLASA
jgi:hypothetical protein